MDSSRHQGFPAFPSYASKSTRFTKTAGRHGHHEEQQRAPFQLPDSFKSTVDTSFSTHSVHGSWGHPVQSYSNDGFLTNVKTPTRVAPEAPSSFARDTYVITEDNLEEMMQQALLLQDAGKLKTAALILKDIECIQAEQEEAFRKQVEGKGKSISDYFEGLHTEKGLLNSKEALDSLVGENESVFSETSEASNGTLEALQSPLCANDSASVAAKLDSLREGSQHLSSFQEKNDKNSVQQASVEFPVKVEEMKQPVDAFNTGAVKAPEVFVPTVAGPSPEVSRKSTPEISAEETELNELQKIVRSIGEDTLLLKSGQAPLTPLQIINEKLKSKQYSVKYSVPGAAERATTVGTAADPDVHASRPIVKVDSNAKRMVTRCGMLLKSPPQDKWFSKWKCKYFVLSGRFLLYFRNEHSRTCDGVVELADAVVEPVAMKTRKQNRVHIEYEIRLKEHRSKRIYRLRPFFGTSLGALEDEVRKHEAAQWAASLKNNIIVASKNADILHKEQEKLRGMRCTCRKHASPVRGFFLSVSDRLLGNDRSYCRACEEGEHLSILGSKGMRASQHLGFQHRWDTEVTETEKIDEVRKKRYFSPGKGNSAPKEIGTDVSIRYEDEDVYAFYRALNLSSSASDKMIKKSYRKLARDLHPDKNINSDSKKERTAQFAKIGRAFDVLKFKETRAEYDNCEHVKELLRKGIIVRLHLQYEEPSTKLLFTDRKFLNLYIQDAVHGTVLQPGYRTIEFRFITHIYTGLDGFAATRVALEEVEEVQQWSLPISIANRAITLHGDRLGEQDWHLELADMKSKAQLLAGLRKLRCDFSELFKQRLEEMQAAGMK